MNLKSYYIFLRIVSYFNTSSSNKTEYSIIVELLNHSFRDPVSIEKMAETCHVSQATISRFVRSLGFKNYNDFSLNFFKSLEIAQITRAENYLNKNIDYLIDEIDNKTQSNLEATKRSLDKVKLNKILDIIINSQNTILFGTPENICQFKSLEKDLLSNFVPCFLFYESKAQKEFSNLANEHTCAIFIVMHSAHLPIYLDRIKELSRRGAKLILFTQSHEDDLHQYFNDIYIYGEQDGQNYGNYSLFYLSKIMSALLYSKLFNKMK